VDDLRFAPHLLKDRVVLVTGGGSGLGRSMAYRFATLGAKVMVGSRKEENLRATCRSIEERGGEAHWKVADVKDPKACDALVEAAYEHFGKIDILINNSAGNFMARTEKLSENAYRSVVGTVLDGTFFMTQAAGKRWIAKKQKGNVLSIVATYAWTGAAHVVPSACAKAGVLALTRSLAVEWAKHGIRLNALAPGPVPTPGAWERLIANQNFEEAARQRIPLQRFGTHQEICDLATFLVSDTSSWITGQVVSSDGGEWLVGNTFQELRAMPAEFWEAMEEMRKPSSKGTPSH
jgi:NAD(P)-dependent dehydrogenase (short-subunit alcohol dehydrogenase family)